MFPRQPAGTVHCWATLGKHCLKAGKVEPDKELSVLLGNRSCTFPRQRIHEKLWNPWAWRLLSRPRGNYKTAIVAGATNNFDFDLNTSTWPSVEEGSNAATTALRVVGGDEKESLKSETVKYGHEPQGTRTPRKTKLARASSIYKRQTRPLVREGATQKQDRNCQTIINIWSWAPDGARHQDLLVDRPSVAM
jgi:hypothetical protein